MGDLAHKVPRTILLSHEQRAALEKLSAETQIPLQTLMRRGIDLVLAEYAQKPARRKPRS
jgi:hypothetical protein